MKRLFFAAGLIVIAIALCIFSSVSVTDKSEEVKSELEKIAVLINEEKTSEAEEALKESEKIWRKAESLFSFIVDADKIEEMNIGFSMIKKHLGDGNTEHALERLHECELMLDEITANERLDIKNIM